MLFVNVEGGDDVVADFDGAFDSEPPEGGGNECGSDPVSGHFNDLFPPVFDKPILGLSTGWGSFDGDMFFVKEGSAFTSYDFGIKVGPYFSYVLSTDFGYKLLHGSGDVLQCVKFEDVAHSGGFVDK